MIEEALLKSNYIGKDGFHWWLGQIAQPGVWKDKSNIDIPGNWGKRCKVRIIGYHPFDPNILKDDDLPWAQVMLDPSFGSAQGGIGGTIDLKGGESCFGFFLDGNDAQQPVVVGLLYRSDGVQNLISPDVLEKEKGSRFKPFTGQPEGVPPTQRDSRQSKSLGDAETSPVSGGIGTSVFTFDPKIGYLNSDSYKVNFQIGDKIAGITKGVPSAATLAVEKKADINLVKPNGCQNNLIGQITQKIQDFVAITNGLDRYLDVYIDPVLNEFVNVKNLIKNTARQITGIVKLILNNLRGTIFKCIVWGFRKFVGLIVPPPQQTIVMEALKKLLDIMFCILEKIPGNILGVIEDSLGDLFSKTINVPSCAVEQWTAGILSEMMNLIDSSLETVMSGIRSIISGIGSITDILNQASSLASQIFTFLECTGLACKKPSVWSSKFGPSQKEADDWQKMVSNVNVINTINSTLESSRNAIQETPLFGNNRIFNTCNEKVSNPTSQRDLMPLPPGLKHKTGLPPIVVITDAGNNGPDGGGLGACAIPIVSSNGSIFSIKVISGGLGYKIEPTVSIIDNSGYGSGARAKSVISAAGTVQSIIVLNPGTGYIQGNYTNIDSLTCSDLDNGAGIGSTVPGPGIGSTVLGPGIGSTVPGPGVSSFVSGCVKDIIILSPGYGYTTGDTISDGKNIYQPIVSDSGAIVNVIMPNSTVCGFDSIPDLIINTNTGVAANVIASMEFVKSYTNDNNNALSGQVAGLGFTSVIDCI